MGIMGFSLIRLFAKVVNVPVHILLPIIVMMTFVGTYSYNNSMNDVYLMVASGFVGYFLNKLDFSMSAIIIGIILGSMAEQNFVGSLIMSDGNFNIFFTRPICLFFLAAAALSLLSPVLGKLFKKA
jgi:putative tricarboxylic transport membrane protein